MSTVQATASMMEYLPEPEQQKVLVFVRNLVSKNSPFKPETEEEFYASIDIGIAQADAGQVQDMDEAIDEISRELGI